ncbi:MAG: sensor histidine kinase [Spirochaetaceae bacterium]|nr:MAG: sensor histidine kinase [Spirochaetaceae bacterium]
MAQAIQALRSRTELTLEDILSIVSSPNYNVRRVEVLDPAGIPPEDLERLEADEIVHVGRGRFQGITTVLRFGDAYISIGLQTPRNLFQIWFSRLWNSIALYVAIAAALILALANKVVHPVLQLTAATQKVARGDFDVRIETVRNDEIGHLTRNFNQMVQELRTIEYLRKDFISNVSHELKTPLAAIQGYARLLQDDRLTVEERNEYAAVIAREAGRLANMSSAMLSLSRLESQNTVESTTEFSLDEQIRRSILVLEPQWDRKRILFDIELIPMRMRGNEELLQQAWLNILGNAVKFTPDGGRVKVRSRSVEGAWEITIRDHGIGISREDLPRVFEKFFQVDRTRAGEGSGLGLSLVKRIITLFRGSITMESTPGEGTTVTVVLPDDCGEEG